jgi:hypothetical protein
MPKVTALQASFVDDIHANLSLEPVQQPKWVQYGIVWLSRLQAPENATLDVLSAIGDGTISEAYIMDAKIPHH